MIFRVMQKSDPSLMPLKQKIRLHDGVRAFKQDNVWYYRIDTDKADMQALQELMKDVIMPDDYAACFKESVTTEQLLEKVQEEISLDKVDGPYELTCDIMRMYHTENGDYLLEVTTDVDGARRLTCFSPSYLIDIENIRPDLQVKLTGSLQWQKDCSSYLLYVIDARVLGPSLLMQHIKDMEQWFQKPEYWKPKKIYPLMPQIERIAVLYPHYSTFEDFQHILLGITDKIRIEGKQIDFTAEELRLEIDELANEDNVRPICIIRGPAIDRYAWAPFYDDLLLSTILLTNAPILLGLGHAKDTTLAAKCADYNAATAQDLATKLGFWKMASWSHEYKEKHRQGKLVRSEQEQQEEETAGFFSFMKKLLPW